MTLGERRHLDRIIGDECRLYERALAEFAENLVDKLALAHGIVDFHLQLLADGAYFVLALVVEVVAGLFLDSFEDRQTAERSTETYYVAVDFALRLAVYCNADALQQLLGEAHHPVIVLILHI